ISAIVFIAPAYLATYDWQKLRVSVSRYLHLIEYPREQLLIWRWLAKLFGAMNLDTLRRIARRPSRNQPIKLFVSLSNLRLKHHRLVRYVVKTQRIRKRVRRPAECWIRCFFTISQHQYRSGSSLRTRRKNGRWQARAHPSGVLPAR